MDYFTLFQLPIAYQIEINQLVTSYQQLQRQFHPDRFAAESESQQLEAMQQATIINDAYQTLKDPLRRAEYFLSLKNINVFDEQKTMYDTAFLLEQLTLREQLEHIATMAEPSSTLVEFNQRIMTMVKQYYQQFADLLDNQQWSEAANIVRKLRFLDKLLQQVTQLEDKLFDAYNG